MNYSGFVTVYMTNIDDKSMENMDDLYAWAETEISNIFGLCLSETLLDPISFTSKTTVETLGISLVFCVNTRSLYNVDRKWDKWKWIISYNISNSATLFVINKSAACGLCGLVFKQEQD